MIPEQRIQTTVSNGVITLSGAVDYASQREDAARAVGHLDGVRAVSNEIKLVPPSVASTTLRSAIEGALDRHATREANKVGLCGQAPSDRPEFAGFLASIGIDSISVTPDALPKVIAHLVARR